MIKLSLKFKIIRTKCLDLLKNRYIVRVTSRGGVSHINSVLTLCMLGLCRLKLFCFH